MSHAVLRVFEGYWLMVDGSRCLGLDATKVSQMFGTAKNGGAIKGLFFCKDFRKMILILGISGLRGKREVRADKGALQRYSCYSYS